jgi:hypothetical protein
MTAYCPEAALKYARVGVAVFPCDPKDKKPLGPRAPGASWSANQVEELSQ